MAQRRGRTPAQKAANRSAGKRAARPLAAPPEVEEEERPSEPCESTGISRRFFRKDNHCQVFVRHGYQVSDEGRKGVNEHPFEFGGKPIGTYLLLNLFRNFAIRTANSCIVHQCVSALMSQRFTLMIMSSSICAARSPAVMARYNTTFTARMHRN